MEKEMEKRNFLNWYCWYASTEEIENARRRNKEAMDRLISEYSDEIERTQKLRRLYQIISRSERMLQSKPMEDFTCRELFSVSSV